MDPTAVTEATRTQQPQIITPEALQAALAVLAPGASNQLPATLNPTYQHQPFAHIAQPQTEQHSPLKQHSKRKGARANADEVPGNGPPRPPPIKHEVYEDLEEKFQQLQSEREPKRHRGNPKGYQIKSFCKNPACGKQLNGGRTNRCEHCGFDLASHRRNAQLERLIKSGPLEHTQVRTVLRDAANEVHVRTGGKAMVLVLVYDHRASAPAQAIAYGKPAAAFVEGRKELITSFEAVCKEHFKEPQQPTAQQESQASQQQQQPPQPLPRGLLPQSSDGPGTVALRPGGLGLSNAQLLSAVTAAAAANSLLQPVAFPAATTAAPGMSSIAASSSTAANAVDLDSVIAAAVSDPAAAVVRCRDARVTGDVLARLPQAMQLTVLMQAGLLPGEAASVVVELESRMRQPPPASAPQLPPLSHPMAAAAGVTPPPPALASMLMGMLPPHSAVQQQQLTGPAPAATMAAQALLQASNLGAAGVAAGAGVVPVGCMAGGAVSAVATGYESASCASVGPPLGVAPPGGPAPVPAAPPAGVTASHGGAHMLGPLQAALMAAAVAGVGSGAGPDQSVLNETMGTPGVVQLHGLQETGVNPAGMLQGLAGFEIGNAQQLPTPGNPGGLQLCAHGWEASRGSQHA